jgi:primosomal protein N'
LKLNTTVEGSKEVKATVADPEGFHEEIRPLLQQQTEKGVLESYDFKPKAGLSPYDFIFPIILAGLVLLILWVFLVGRAGRGDSEGKAWLQTMNPMHKVITLAASQDYDGFYDTEINLRRVQSAPPFGDFAMVTFTGLDEARVLHGAAKFKNSLNALLNTSDYQAEQCTVLGPAPCPVPKINYNFRHRLTLRCRMTKQLRMLLAHLLRQFSQDRENRGVTAFIDVNGYD